MTLDNLFRVHALYELRRYWPLDHYVGRDHDPMADLDLVTPLLEDSVRYKLTAKEGCAAEAVKNWAMYQLRIREIWPSTTKSPVDDSELQTRLLQGGMKCLSENTYVTAPEYTQLQGLEVWALREVFRRSAFVYARMLREVELVEYFQTPEHAPETLRLVPKMVESASESPSEHLGLQKAQELEILKEIRKLGYDPMKLPKFKGKLWVKSAVYTELLKNKLTKNLFSTRGIYTKAWERLSAQKLISEVRESGSFSSAPVGAGKGSDMEAVVTDRRLWQWPAGPIHRT